MQAVIEHIEKVCSIVNCGYRPDGKKPIVCFGCKHYRVTDLSMIISAIDNSATEELRFVGDDKQKRYTGDGIDCRVNQIIKISKAKKAQLLKDYPKWFAEAKKENWPEKLAALKLPELKETALKMEVDTTGMKRPEIEAALLKIVEG